MSKDTTTRRHWHSRLRQGTGVLVTGCSIYVPAKPTPTCAHTSCPECTRARQAARRRVPTGFSYNPTPPLADMLGPRAGRIVKSRRIPEWEEWAGWLTPLLEDHWREYGGAALELEEANAR